MMFRSLIMVVLFASVHANAVTPITPKKSEEQLPNQTMLESSEDLNSNRSVHLGASKPLDAGTSQNPILKGNSEISASFVFSKAYSGSSPSTLELFVEYGYFVADHISVGPMFSFYDEDSEQASRLGVVSSYYFMDKEKQAARIQVGTYLGLTDNVAKLRAFGEFRYEFFFAHHASFGPYARLSRYIRDEGRSDYNVVDFGAGFSIYF